MFTAIQRECVVNACMCKCFSMYQGPVFYIILERCALCVSWLPNLVKFNKTQQFASVYVKSNKSVG